jgi:tRNA threonylcarbamoyl adenosine modification protein YeaZ
MNLFISTALDEIILATIDENEQVNIHKEKSMQDTSTKVLLNIKKLADNIKKIYVTVGPGSFTGLRIGVTIAKTLGYALNIPVIPISTLEMLASSSKEEKILALIDARNNNVYAGFYDNNLTALKPDIFANYDELEKGNYTIVKNTTNIDILKIIEKHKLDKAPIIHNINPVYLKLSSAEENLNND